MNKTSRFVAAGVTALVLAGGVGVGIAAADPSSPAPDPATSASPSQAPPTDQKADKKADKADRRQRPLTARALHGEATLAGRDHRVVAFQRGTVDAVSATSITISSADGFSATYVVNAGTKVRVDKAQAGIDDVETADRVRIVATKDGSTLTATRIADRGPK